MERKAFDVGDVHRSKDPEVEVIFDNTHPPLPMGEYVFELVVVDDENFESLPSQVKIWVLAQDRPTAILHAKSTKVRFGSSIYLTGRESTDVPPGKIVEYRFRRLS